MTYEQVHTLVLRAMKEWSTSPNCNVFSPDEWKQIRSKVIQDAGWSVEDFNTEFERRLTETEIGISEWLDRQNENYPFVE
jgi:hypothetical protein